MPWNKLTVQDSTTVNVGDILRFDVSYTCRMTNVPSSSDVGQNLQKLAGIKFRLAKATNTGASVAGEVIGSGPTPITVYAQMITKSFGFFGDLQGITVNGVYRYRSAKGA